MKNRVKIVKRTVAIMLILSSFAMIAACVEPAPSETESTTPNAAVTTPNDDTTQSADTTSAPTEDTTTLPTDSTTAPSGETQSPGVLDKTKTYSVLFIGNSYTYYNSMPETHFKMMMRDAGYDVTVKSLTKGSQKLLASASPSDELGAKIDKALKEEKFDFVILQEAGSQAITKPQAFLFAVRTLAEKIRANGATPILYCVWGSKEGRESLSQYGGTTESMMWKIAASHEKVGGKLEIEIANVGMAFYDVHNDYSENKINLYNTDLYHPSDAGSYLAALTIFAEITGVDPITITYNGSLTSDNAKILKSAAKEAVFATPEIPAEYK